MIKNNDYPVPSGQQIIDTVINSPYYNISSEYWHRKGVLEPTYLHALVAFHEFAKIDHKINKRED